MRKYKKHSTIQQSVVKLSFLKIQKSIITSYDHSRALQYVCLSTRIWRLKSSVFFVLRSKRFMCSINSHVMYSDPNRGPVPNLQVRAGPWGAVQQLCNWISR